MQIEYNTGKADILLVKLADGARALGTEINEALDLTQLYYLSDFMGLRDIRGCTDLPKGNWHLIGNPFELTEEQAKELVDGQTYNPLRITYKDYVNGYYQYSALESFGSLLAHLEIHQTNPLQDEWDEVCIWGHGSHMTMKEYQEAGKRSGNWVLLARDVEGN